MEHSPLEKRLVFGLSGITSVLLVVAAYWTKSADIAQLPPIIEVAGNLHPLFLHLPIGVFIYLAFAETWNLLDRALLKRGQIRGALPVLIFGTITAVAAAAVGLLLYLQGDYSGDLVEAHLNWGIGFAVSSMLVLCCAIQFGEHTQAYRIVLLLSAVTVSVAGHWGGLITHGDPLKPLQASASSEEATPVDFETLTTYTVVDKIFREKCYSCHAVDTKQKGGLLMDSYEALLTGGKKGNALVAGDLANSKISSYVHLPLDDEHHMPPEGKPQLTADEIAFIDHWIATGASHTAKFNEDTLSDKLSQWAHTFMQQAAPVATATALSEADTTPQVDLSADIQHVEAHIENSITRIGDGGQQLLFTAVNARSNFSDDTLAHLEALAPHLIEIDLSRTQITATGLRALLSQTTQLQRLNLAETTVGSEWIDPGLPLDQLKNLILFGTPLEADSLSPLSNLTQLESLYVAQTGLTNEHVTQIRKALSDCQVVSDDYLTTHQPKEPVIEAPAPAPEPVKAITPAAAPSKNLAAGKSVSASSHYHAGNETFPPTNVTDGRQPDTGKPGDWSFWLAQNDVSGAITIDLGSVQTINRVDLQNTRNRQHNDRGLKAFVLKLSTDGQDYETILEGDLPPVAGNEANAYPFHPYTFKPTQARYVHIAGTAHYGRSGGLNEVRVFAAKPHIHEHTHDHDHNHDHDHTHTHEDAPAASEQSHLTGNAAHTYRSDPHWAKFPDGKPIGATHGGIAISKDGTVYVATDGPRAISVFDAAGNYLRSFHHQFGGVHSLQIHEEEGREYLYGAHLRGQRIIKLDLEGNLIQEIKHSDQAPIPGTFKGLTSVTVAPDGRIYATIGYGSNHLHIFSPDGTLLETRGSHGTGDDQTRTNHGIAIDPRYEPARLLIADRENRRLVHYDLDGNFIAIYAENLRRPCSFSFHGEICAVAELQARVTLLDTTGTVLTHLGDNPDKKLWANFQAAPDALAPNIFSAPHGLCFDNDGNLLVQDWNKTGRLTKLTHVKPE